MPYTIKREGSKHCVYKVNGGKVACHETRQGAVRQIAAIESSEKSKSAALAMNLSFFDSTTIGKHQFYLAHTPEQRREGLRGLAGLDKAGMVFEYDDDVTTPYTMAEMEFDLDIAFFDAEGNCVKKGTYPSHYRAPIFAPPYRYVVEAPAGKLDLETLDMAAHHYGRMAKKRKRKG